MGLMLKPTRYQSHTLAADLSGANPSQDASLREQFVVKGCYETR